VVQRGISQPFAMIGLIHWSIVSGRYAYNGSKRSESNLWLMAAMLAFWMNNVPRHTNFFRVFFFYFTIGSVGYTRTRNPYKNLNLSLPADIVFNKKSMAFRTWSLSTKVDILNILKYVPDSHLQLNRYTSCTFSLPVLHMLILLYICYIILYNHNLR